MARLTNQTNPLILLETSEWTCVLIFGLAKSPERKWEPVGALNSWNRSEPFWNRSQTLLDGSRTEPKPVFQFRALSGTGTGPS